MADIAHDARARMPSFPNIAALGEYLRAGRQLVPLHRSGDRDARGRARGKSPLHPQWQRRPYDSAQVVERAGTEGRNVGVRLGDDDLVIDVDPRNFPPGDQDPFIDLVLWFGLDPDSMPHVVTGSGGDHYYLKKPAGWPTVETLPDFPGIEFKTRGRQVVAAGSVHPNGRRYEWDDFAGPPSADVEAPEALLDALRRPEPRPETVEAGELSSERLAACLDQLDPEDFRGHDGWLELMMACHHGTAGGGRQEFIDWSTSDPEYAGHEWIIGHRWDSLRADRGGSAVTVRTLYRAVLDRGGSIPAVPPEEDFEPWEETEPAVDPRAARGRFLTFEEVVAMRPPEWLVHGLVPVRSVGSLYGPSSAWKSFMALDLALSVSLGAECFGRPTRRGDAFYIAAENPAGYRLRVMAWCQHRGVDGADRFFLQPGSTMLNRSGEAERLARDIRATSDSPALVVVDTFSANFDGKENTDDAAGFLRACQEVSRLTGAAVLFVHHVGKDEAKGMRGHYSLRGNTDFVLKMERREDVATLTVEKAKDAPDGAAERFTAVKVTVDPGAEFPDSLVLMPADDAAAERDFLGDADGDLLLIASEMDGRTVTDLVAQVMKLLGVKSVSTARRRINEAFGVGKGDCGRPVPYDGGMLWLERADARNKQSGLVVRRGERAG